MNPGETELLERLPLRFRGRWLQGYARGKLRSDPVYRASFARLGASALPLLDIGCGLGLHAFYLRERGYSAPILGLDVDAKKIAAGQAVAAAHYPGVTLRIGDGAALPEFSGHVSLLDVLHYFSPDAQAALLAGLAQRTAPGGWCIIRTTPRDGSWRFRATQALEHFARGIAWMTRPALAFPTLAGIAREFPEAEFTHDVQPLWGNTPFNSWLLAFQRR